MVPPAIIFLSNLVATSYLYFYYFQLRLGFVSDSLLHYDNLKQDLHKVVFFLRFLLLPFPLPVSFLLPLPLPLPRPLPLPLPFSLPLTNFGRSEFTVLRGKRKSVNSILVNGQEEKTGSVDKDKFLDLMLFFGDVFPREFEEPHLFIEAWRWDGLNGKGRVCDDNRKELSVVVVVVVVVMVVVVVSTFLRRVERPHLVRAYRRQRGKNGE